MEQKSSIGGIIGTVIIIAIIILGGLYFWGKRIEESKMNQAIIGDSTSQSGNQNMAVQSGNETDDLNSIEADLNNSQTANLDAELNTK
jgi:hypothetical protein